MDEVLVKRLVYIIACMALKGSELVEDTANDECYIWMGMYEKDIPVTYEEVMTLFKSDITEVDSGCEEEGYEKTVYRLTETAVEKVQKFVDEEIEKRKAQKRLQ